MIVAVQGHSRAHLVYLSVKFSFVWIRTVGGAQLALESVVIFWIVRFHNTPI